MSDHRIPLLFLFLCMLLFMPVQADAQSLEQSVLDLQKRYQDLTSLGFDFIQTTRTGRRNRIGSGNAVFVRTGGDTTPGIMRWNYLKPDQQIILNNGKELFIYSRNDKQLIITPAAEINNDITYRFFTGNGHITDDFTIFPPDNRYVFSLQGINLTAVKLTPRTPHPQIRMVQIWFDDAMILHRLVMEDHFDSVTQLTFTNIQLNPVQADDRDTISRILDLNLPDDTEIIRQ